MSEPDINLFDPATLIDPYPAYQTLRDEAPVYFAPAMNVHVITRYDLVRAAIKDTKTFSSRFDGFLQESQRIAFANASPEVQAELMRLGGEMIDLPPTMLTLDEPDHTRYRSLVNKLFTVSRIRESQAAVAGVIDDTIAGLGGASAFEFVTGFAAPVPLRIIADRLGIPEADRDFFDDAATAAASALRLTPLPGEEMVRRAQLALDLQKLCVRLVEERRAQPADDMITILANSKLEGEDRLLTHGECISILNQFLVAGHETTASAFAWGMLLLCRNPDLQERLRAEPELVKTFVEETLRVEAPVQGLPRLVTQDTELGGVALPAGSMVMLRFGAANRDEREFPNPEQVDLQRRRAGAQLAFGSGVHFCIGAPLARQELNLGFPALIDYAAEFALDPDKPAPEAEASFVLRNLPQLHVRCAPRA
ncbi:MAG: cytochrome P450 [Pseudomonadota bacterium]